MRAGDQKHIILLEWPKKELCHDLRQEPETTTVLCALIGTATVLCTYQSYAPPTPYLA